MRKLLLITIAVLAIETPGFSGQLEIGVNQVVFIESPEGGYRALLTFDVTDAIMDSEIEYAKLVLPYALVSPNVDLEIHSISTSWTIGSVSWNSPWHDAGGDYAPVPHAVSHLHPGQPEGKEYFIDVTEHLRELQTGQENHGFIIMPTVENGQGFDASIRELLEPAGSLMIRLYVASNM
jgi:hypothetical protein